MAVRLEREEGQHSLDQHLQAPRLSFSPLLTVTTVAEAILVAVVVSIIAGIYPAWRASKMQPIDALRQL